MRKKYAQLGFSAFCEHQILELILMYSFRRTDTNPIAHHILNKKHDLATLFSSDCSDIIDIAGMGAKSVEVLNTVGKAVRYISNLGTTPVHLNKREFDEFICRAAFETSGIIAVVTDDGGDPIQLEQLPDAYSDGICIRTASKTPSGTESEANLQYLKNALTRLSVYGAKTAILIARSYPDYDINDVFRLFEYCSSALSSIDCVVVDCYAVVSDSIEKHPVRYRPLCTRKIAQPLVPISDDDYHYSLN